VAVKGRNQSIYIFELLGVAGDPLAAGRLVRLTAYENALAAAHRRDFQEALDLLAPLTDDAAGAVLADRCRHWKQEPPPVDWDGTWVAASK
jgi:adenylate cyclase